jgi:hypothetical protein
MSKLDHAASLFSSDPASTRKATLQHRTTNRNSINTRYGALYLRRKVAKLALSVLFLEGTVSRVDAAMPFTGIRKTRKRQSLRQQRLASTLHLEKTSTKAKSQNFSREADKLDERTIENRKDLRASRRRCLAAEPRKTVPAYGSSSAYASNN